MTFSNLCELYENACLDYEVSVLTEGADSGSSAVALYKKQNIAMKIYNVLKTLIMKLIAAIKQSIDRISVKFKTEMVQLTSDIEIIPLKYYKEFIPEMKKFIKDLAVSKGLESFDASWIGDLHRAFPTDVMKKLTKKLESFSENKKIMKTGEKININQYKDFYYKIESQLKRTYSRMSMWKATKFDKVSPIMFQSIFFTYQFLTQIRNIIDGDMLLIGRSSEPVEKSTNESIDFYSSCILEETDGNNSNNAYKANRPNNATIISTKKIINNLYSMVYDDNDKKELDSAKRMSVLITITGTLTVVSSLLTSFFSAFINKRDLVICGRFWELVTFCISTITALSSGIATVSIAKSQSKKLYKLLIKIKESTNDEKTKAKCDKYIKALAAANANKKK